MRRLYEECQAQSSLKKQLDWAATVSAEKLAEAFRESVDQFAGYCNAEPFYPASRGELSKPVPDATIRRCRDLAAYLRMQGVAFVVNDPSLKLRYLDYEVVPARTTGGASYNDGKRSTTWVRLDLLLHADGPVIAEVKLRSDKNPFYALLQALTCAVELATPSQRIRLQSRYSQINPASPLEIYTVIYRPSVNGEDWHRLLLRSEEMSRKLISLPSIRRYIGRFAILELLEPKSGIISFKRVFKT